MGLHFAVSCQINGRVVLGFGCPFSVGLQELAQAQSTVQQLRKELLVMQVAARQQARAQVLPPCAGPTASCGLECDKALIAHEEYMHKSLHFVHSLSFGLEWARCEGWVIS